MKEHEGTTNTTTIGESIVNGTSSTALKVTIVGGGLGGLTAALALRQEGHDVQIFEQSRLADEVGAAIHTTPNATSILERLGVDPRKSGAVPIKRVQRPCNVGRLW